MKKAILLLTFVCVSQLYGMNEELNPEIWQKLPEDIKSLIMVALAQSGDNVDDAIKNIGRVSRINPTLNKTLNNLEGFTALMHILADRFNMTPYEVAEKIKTPMARQYRILADALKTWTERGNKDKVQESITKGADIAAYPQIVHIAMDNIYRQRPAAELIQVLLEHGADPLEKIAISIPPEKLSPLERLNRLYKNHPDYEVIKKLLENAMAKQQK